VRWKQPSASRTAPLDGDEPGPSLLERFSRHDARRKGGQDGTAADPAASLPRQACRYRMMLSDSPGWSRRKRIARVSQAICRPPHCRPDCPASSHRPARFPAGVGNPPASADLAQPSRRDGRCRAETGPAAWSSRSAVIPERRIRPIWAGNPHHGSDRSQLLPRCALTAEGSAARSLMIRLHGFRAAANVTDVMRFAETEIQPKPDARFPCRVPVPSAVHLLSEQAK
jgi:hypothetical protein